MTTNTTDTFLEDGRATTKNAAKYLGLSLSTLNKLRYYKKGPPYVKMMHTIFYFRKDLDEWISSFRKNPIDS